jgi:hypothetical protein
MIDEFDTEAVGYRAQELYEKDTESTGVRYGIELSG